MLLDNMTKIPRSLAEHDVLLFYQLLYLRIVLRHLTP